MISNIFFTRIMPQHHFGYYSTYWSVVSILVPFAGLNLFFGLANGYIDYNGDRKHFRASLFFLSFLYFLLFFSLVTFFSAVAKKIFPVKIPLFITVFALFQAYSIFVINFFCTYENMENNYKIKTLLLVSPPLLQVVLSLLLIIIVSKNSYYERVIGSGLGYLFIAVILGLIMLNRQKYLLNKEYYKYSLAISIPSVLSSISYMLLHQSDHIMITIFVGAEYTAVYSLVYIVGNVIYGFLEASSGAFQAWLYRALDKKEIGSSYVVQKWNLVYFLVIIYGILMVSPEIIKILSPKNYWDFRFIPPFVLGSSVLVISNLYCLVGEFYKKNGIISLIVLSTAVLNIVLNFIFIRKFGAIAAAYTTLITNITFCFLIRCLSQKIQKNFYNDKFFLLYFIVAFLGCLLFLLVYKMTLIRYILFFLCLCIIGIYCLMNRRELLSLVGLKGSQNEK